MFDLLTEENVLSSIPKKYRQVEMKYSKLGKEICSQPVSYYMQ